MTMTFYDDIKQKIKQQRKELLQLVSTQEMMDIQEDTENYSDFIIQVGKLSGKIEGLELSLKIYKKYNS